MKKRNILFNLLVFGILILGLHINVNAQEASVPDGYTGIYNIADLDGIRNNPSGKYIGRYQLTASYLNGDYSPENQERVANEYVMNRYGSWVEAQQFLMSNCWY